MVHFFLPSGKYTRPTYPHHQNYVVWVTCLTFQEPKRRLPLSAPSLPPSLPLHTSSPGHLSVLCRNLEWFDVPRESRRWIERRWQWWSLILVFSILVDPQAPNEVRRFGVPRESRRRIKRRRRSPSCLFFLPPRKLDKEHGERSKSSDHKQKKRKKNLKNKKIIRYKFFKIGLNIDVFWQYELGRVWVG